MDSFQHVITTLMQILIELGRLSLDALISTEDWVRDRLGEAGVSANVQTAIMIAVAVVLLLGALRLFGGLIRVFAVLVLLLIAIHILLPVLRHP